MGKKEVKKKSLIIKTESKVGRSPKQKRKVAETKRRKKSKNRKKTEANTGKKNKATTAYLPRRRHNNCLVSLSTTAPPPSAGRKLSEIEKERSKDKEKEEEQKQKKIEATTGKNRATTAYLPRRRHNNRLESLSTTAAPPLAGRKPSETVKDHSRDKKKEEEQKQRKTVPQFTSGLRQPNFAAAQGSLLFPFSFSFFCFICPTPLFTLHVNSGVRLHCSRSKPTFFTGSSPVKKIEKIIVKNTFQKHCFLIFFLVWRRRL